MYFGTEDPMLQVARYKNHEDVARAAAHHAARSAAQRRADDRVPEVAAHQSAIDRQPPAPATWQRWGRLVW